MATLSTLSGLEMSSGYGWDVIFIFLRPARIESLGCKAASLDISIWGRWMDLPATHAGIDRRG